MKQENKKWVVDFGLALLVVVGLTLAGYSLEGTTTISLISYIYFRSL